MKCDVYKVIVADHTLSNATKMTRQSFTVEISNNPKHTAKATQEGFC